MRFSLKSTRLGLRHSTTRIPFRYGKACLTSCPQALLSVTIEHRRVPTIGFAGDCLPPGWFDKSPDKSFAVQIGDMLRAISFAEKTFLEEFATATEFFPTWLVCYERIQDRVAEWGLTPLLASFAISLPERAVMDALARASGLSLFAALRQNIYAIAPGDVHQELAGRQLVDWLPARPKSSIAARHTVGLGDPLTKADLAPGSALDDGWPETLEQYVAETGLRYFKVKVQNDLDADLDRLRRIATLIEHHRQADYAVTLDGNEQYGSLDEFHELVEQIRRDATLDTLWNNTLLIEQPLHRATALDIDVRADLDTLMDGKPIIIDESDGRLDSFARALPLGYRGVSSKNCKGPLKSLLNAGLVWHRNAQVAGEPYLMTGEDLCSVGVVPVQADLCLAAALGLEHVERNGHHFHPGLDYLPPAARRQALQAHPDYYREHRGRIAPRLVDGRFDIRSLQCVGFGFAALPDEADWVPAADWTYESLGLDD